VNRPVAVKQSRGCGEMRFGVPLALPVFAARRGKAIQHWQSQWHTERNGQLISLQVLSRFLLRGSLRGKRQVRRLASLRVSRRNPIGVIIIRPGTRQHGSSRQRTQWFERRATS